MMHVSKKLAIANLYHLPKKWIIKGHRVEGKTLFDALMDDVGNRTPLYAYLIESNFDHDAEVKYLLEYMEDEEKEGLGEDGVDNLAWRNLEHYISDAYNDLVRLNKEYCLEEKLEEEIYLLAWDDIEIDSVECGYGYCQTDVDPHSAFFCLSCLEIFCEDHGPFIDEGVIDEGAGGAWFCSGCDAEVTAYELLMNDLGRA